MIRTLAVAATMSLSVTAVAQPLIAATTYCDVYQLNTSTGASALVGNIPGSGSVNPVALAYDFAGNRLFMTNYASPGRLFLVDTTTLQRTEIGGTGTLGVFPALAWDSSTATLFGAGGQNGLYRMNTMTGAATLVSALTPPMVGLAYSAITDTLFGISNQTNSLYTINRTTGAASLVGALGVSTFFAGTGMSFHPTTDTLYITAAGPNRLYSVNTTTGVASLIGLNTISSPTLTITFIPAPGVAGLLAIAGGFGVIRRRR